jgi:hypothetical protein
MSHSKHLCLLVKITQRNKYSEKEIRPVNEKINT